MKKENEIKARLKDIIATLNEVDEGSLDYYCLLQKKRIVRMDFKYSSFKSQYPNIEIIIIDKSELLKLGILKK